jgi:hypothetical protein
MTYTFKLARRLAGNHRATALAFASSLLLLGCAGGNSLTGSTNPPPSSPVPTGGWLTLQLTTPRSDDGAVQLYISGPGIDSVRVQGYDGYASQSSTAGYLLVTGAITSGTIGQVYVPDLAHTTEYRATVTGAAARSTYALQDLTGYRVALVR